MIFTFDICSGDLPAQQATIVLLIHGRLVDPSALAITINGVDRQAQWSGNELVLNAPIEVRFSPSSSRLLYQLETDELPASAAGVLNAISDAGVEAAVGNCDLCGAVAPVRLITALTVCACPACQKGKHLDVPGTSGEPMF